MPGTDREDTETVTEPVYESNQYQFGRTIQVQLPQPDNAGRESTLTESAKWYSNNQHDPSFPNSIHAYSGSDYLKVWLNGKTSIIDRNQARTFFLAGLAALDYAENTKNRLGDDHD